MIKFNPKVSIIIPVFNGSNFLKEAIDSALAQTYKNLEIIVVNDGSKDSGATEKIAQSYGDKIRYYSKENGGVATALNTGLEKMTGEYFSWLSHDDEYTPTKIEKQIDFLSTREDKDVILYSNYDIMDENGRHTDKCRFDHDMLERVPMYGLLRGMINGITMLIPKSAFDKYGRFNADLRCTQDYDMWHRMTKTYRFIHMNELLSITRIHSMQDTQVSPRVVTEGNALWNKMVDQFPDKEKIKAEGSLLKFYLEMIKFLRYTPYSGTLEHCRQLLLQVAQTKEVVKGDPESIIVAGETYDELVGADEKKTAAYYLHAVVKQLVDTNKMKQASRILSEKLIGESAGLDEKEIKRYYLPKIANKSKKPRLMFSTGHWLTGGMERVLSNLFKQLSDDYDLFLLTAFDGRHGKIELPSYVTHIKMSNELFYDAYSQTALSYALMFDIDVAVGFMNLFNGQLDFYELCAGTKVKTIASNNEMYFYPYHNPDYYGMIQHRIDMLQKADATLWPTNFSAAAYGLVGDNSYLMANPNTFEVQKTHNNGEQKIILCVGRFNDYVKRVDLILKSFSEVLKSQPDAKLMLVGKCDRDEPIRANDWTINGLLKELKINEDRVIFVGEVDNTEKYYAQASVLLLTSNSEGFGMVISEAACFGVPAVCSKIPGLEDLITDGKNGFLVSQNDIKAMAAAVSDILSDSSLHKRLSENAKKMVSRFDRVEIGNKWKYLINTLLENGPDTNKKLNKGLAYKIDDYKDFSRILFDELGKVTAINLYERNELLNSTAGSRASLISKTKHRFHRLRRSLKTKGVSQTGVLIAKKIYRKTQRLYKDQ